MDWLNGGSGDDLLGGGAGNGVLTGFHGNDSLVSGEGNDRLRAGLGDDGLVGGPSNDTLQSAGGNDSLNGNDAFYGNAGTDVFVFSTANGHDTIRDFSDGEDLIDLTAFGLTNGLDDVATSRHQGRLLPDLSEHGGGSILIKGTRPNRRGLPVLAPPAGVGYPASRKEAGPSPAGNKHDETRQHQSPQPTPRRSQDPTETWCAPSCARGSRRAVRFPGSRESSHPTHSQTESDSGGSNHGGSWCLE